MVSLGPFRIHELETDIDADDYDRKFLVSTATSSGTQLSALIELSSQWRDRQREEAFQLSAKTPEGEVYNYINMRTCGRGRGRSN